MDLLLTQQLSHYTLPYFLPVRIHTQVQCSYLVEEPLLLFIVRGWLLCQSCYMLDSGCCVALVPSACFDHEHYIEVVILFDDLRSPDL